MADESERDEKSRDIKVTDRRMFTPDGKLKEEYRWLEEEKKGSAEEPRERRGGEATERGQTPPQETPASAGAPVPGEAPLPPGASPTPGAAGPGPAGEAAPGPTGTPLELPDTPDSLGKPGFLDLLAVLAEPATIYLGDAALPDGRQAEDLRAARLYIDMLTVLREKTNGNLSAQEQAVMDDLLYRLQMRYIQKRG